jgi:thiamine-phosphate pyrophosphorylase
VSTLADALLYLVAPARIKAGPLVDLVPELAAAGVDILQLREKDMEAGDLLRVGEPLAAACSDAEIPFVVNDRPDVALALGADGVHLGQNDLPVGVARRICGGAIVGISTHSEPDIDSVTTTVEPIDYAAVGPVFSTPTKPGRRAVGSRLLTYAAEHLRIPWFAIGGIDSSNLDRVIGAGASRIVVVRAITESSDPPGAAGELKQRLELVRPGQ